MPRFIMALDQGTTSSRALLFDEHARVAAVAQHEFTQHFRQPGWVEHDAQEIWQTQVRAAREVLAKAGAAARDVAAIGITNQRETTVVWERASGAPIHPAIVWQSRQSAPLCEAARARGLEAEVKRRTGLPIDAYFSATKVQFILDAVPGARARAQRGELAFGTVDSWLLFKLTGGAVHATEPSNAARTLLFNIHECAWDETLLEAFGVPRALLPEVRDSSGVFGETAPEIFDAPLPIAGALGDQQAALFGQGCTRAGRAKNTYGTGCFLLMNTGERAPTSASGLLSTVAWRRAGRTSYALEGSVFVAGSAVQWLRDGLGLFASAGESEALARSVPDNGGVFLVPAFTGLGAPYWDERARGVLVGLTRGATSAHLTRAALEAIAYQTRDLVECFRRDAGFEVETLRVDGGACANDFLMQFQADLLGLPLRRPRVLEVTALGAAALAALAVGFWQSESIFEDTTDAGATLFEPKMKSDERENLYAQWQRAVERSRNWETT